MTQNEKFGGRLINKRRSKYLWSTINNCQLIDFGYRGCKYTWSNKSRKGRGLIMERLDKVFANEH